MMNWQPIETAPKDGTKILLYYPARGYGDHRIVTGNWNDMFFSKRPKPYWENDQSFLGVAWMRATQPTHWAKLTPPD